MTSPMRMQFVAALAAEESQHHPSSSACQAHADGSHAAYTSIR
jgi:hypothetical protein